MKKIYILLILALVASHISTRTYADTRDLSPKIGFDAIIDGLRYEIYNGEAHVVYFEKRRAHVIIPSHVTARGKKYPVVEIAPCAFFEYDHVDGVRTNPLLRTIELPSTLRKIDDHAFSGCRNLQSIVIPNSVTELGRSVFDRCISLKEVELPNTITVIKESAFQGCSNLKSIIIPESVEKIEMYAFHLCKNLEFVDFLYPNTVVHENAFLCCSKDIEYFGWNGRMYKIKETKKDHYKDGKYNFTSYHYEEYEFDTKQ